LSRCHNSPSPTLRMTEDFKQVSWKKMCLAETMRS
jgi:hypothetical protein